MAGVSVSGKIQRFSAGGRFHSQSNMAHAPQAGAAGEAFRLSGVFLRPKNPQKISQIFSVPPDWRRI
jgi:hypothetical protein